jgi:hypothetical protein
MSSDSASLTFFSLLGALAVLIWFLSSITSSPSPRWWKFWRWSWWRDYHRLTAYATMLLAVGTLTLAGFSLIQILDFRDQEHRQLRGYFGVSDVSLKCANCTDEIDVTFDNFGQTPLYIISADVSVKEYTVTERFPATEPTWEVSKEVRDFHSEAVIYPRHPNTGNFLANDDVLRTAFADVKSGRYWMILIFKVRYRDIFNDIWSNTHCEMYGFPQYDNRFLNCYKYNYEINETRM